MSHIAVIIVAAGNGTRMGTEIPKQFLPVCDIPILVHTVRRFSELLPQAQIIVVVSTRDMFNWSVMARKYNLPSHEVCVGGETRFESVKNALKSISDVEIVLIHDGVRPVIGKTLIENVISTVEEYGTAIPAVEPVDSYRMTEPDGSSKSLDRSRLRAIQTPQGFKTEILKKAYGVRYQASFTDDASVVEHNGIKPTLCQGDRSNIKVTTPQDLELVEFLLKNVML